MSSKKISICTMAALLVVVWGTAASAALTPRQRLGMFLYMDKNLSNPTGQACMTCHHPSAGFADPANRKDPVNQVVSVGADGISVGGRNAPSAAYASFSPPFRWDDGLGSYVGGQFWDGRASTLADQAKGPFLNPVEMANTKEGVVAAVRQSAYAGLFIQVFGPGSLDNVESAYNNIASAIADYEGTSILNKFSSKYDRYMARTEQLTAKEQRGLALFEGKANCAACHPSPLFTDFTYDNLGIPKSTNPLLVNNPIDYGLGGRTDLQATDPDYVLQYGKFKVPTLRNIAKTAPYGHNGYFPTLTSIVNFYNTASNGLLWPAPEVPYNVNRVDLGDLGLTAAEVDDIVAFLKTLSD